MSANTPVSYVAILDLPPLPTGMTHTYGHDQKNRDNVWLAHCPACMYRYGFKNGVATARVGMTYADGTRLIVNAEGQTVIEPA